MYLKKLNVQGFKSFANRTSFDFGGGVTAVVGPNGSGKSNVADAIRWVLGEQSSKLLRARKQEDVIFAGTKDRAAVGMAEVMLTLDNGDGWLPMDFAEVEIGRRVYRNGDSEYLLNGSRVRLRDVSDLLMQADVGQNSYAIMGQGLVDEVLSMNADERRTFIDEAADVRRFRLRIREAQERLAATRDNIDRVTLVVREIEPRLAQLSRQAERAIEHQRLSAELLELLRAYFSHRWNETQNHLVRSRAALDQYSAEGTSAGLRVEQLRDQIRTLGEEIRKRRETIARHNAARVEAEERVTRATQAVVIDRERQAMAATRIDELRTEVSALESEQALLAAATEGDTAREDEIARELSEAAELMAQSRQDLDSAERDYGNARAHVREVGEARETAARRFATLQGELTRTQRRLQELEAEDLTLAPRRSELLAALAAYARRHAGLRERAAEAEYSLSDARGAGDRARAGLSRVREDLEKHEAAYQRDVRELDRLEGRLDALRRVKAEHDSVAAGTRNALVLGQALIEGIDPESLGEPPEVRGMVGLLARQIRVPAGLETAINAALEYRLHAVVVRDEAAALQAVALLRERRQGRAQFMAMDSIRHAYPLNLQKERGVVGVAAKLVRCDAELRPIVDTLLGRVIVVEDVESGRRMMKRSLGTAVTLDGTYFEASGVVSGGATGADEGPFARQRELDELPGEIEELRRRTAASAAALERAQAASLAFAADAADADQGSDEMRALLDSVRVEMDRERALFQRVRRDLESLHARRDEFTRERERQALALAQASEGLAGAENEGQGESSIEEAEAALAAATARRESALQAMSEAGSRHAAIEGERRALAALRGQREDGLRRLVGQLQARNEQVQAMTAESEAIAARIAARTRDLEAEDAARALDDDAAPDRDELTRFEAHERQVQEELAAAQAALLDADRRRLDLEADVARASESLAVLREEMAREGLGPDATGMVVPLDAPAARAEADGTVVPAVFGGAEIDVEETRGRIDELRRQIRRLGQVNSDAGEDYRESKERHEFLTTQLADLAEAESQLREAIVELGGEIRTRFDATFERVNTSFGEHFAAFFGGGSARLLLTDPENPAESGVEIEAQPPGKRVRTLTLLSGGERSLTAVALLFALLTVNPAPFCVLDEVDAALDEANVGRFTDALRKLAERTQFIVITHNRKTVEMCETIYGVSMARDGVSKVLSLRLADVPVE